MSTNLMIFAEAEVTMKDGSKITIRESLDLFQTPTEVTNELIASDDTLSDYKEYVQTLDAPELLVKHHFLDLDKFIDKHQEPNWEIIIEEF